MWVEPTSYSAAKLGATDSCARKNATTPTGTEMIVRAVSVMRLLLLVWLEGLRSPTVTQQQIGGIDGTSRGYLGGCCYCTLRRKNMRILITLATAVTTVATVAFAQMAPTKTGDSAKGKVLTNDKGMTLICLRQGFWRQVGLQWPMRRQL